MKPTRVARLIVLLNCAVPATLLGWDAWHGRLGANPVNFAIRTTGLLSLIFLLLSLTITPVSRLTGWGWLIQFRRMLGLYAFFHTCLHFSIFFGFDRERSISSTFSEIIKRPYLMVGAAGLLLMVPLAVTSTNGMIRRLGPKRWKALHRLAYLAAIAGVVHYYMLVKADVTQPIVFASVLAVLLGYRVVAHYLKLRAAARQLKKLKAAPAAAAPAVKPKFWSGKLKVVHVFDETPEVRTFRLAPIDGGPLPFDHLPGQYLNLALVIDGKKVNRSYTIASPPTRNRYCELTIKRERPSVSSGYMHDCVRTGDLLAISAPAGRFTFTGAESNRIVLIAGGVGITPLMAKVRYLTDVGWPGDIHLLYCVRTEQDIIFRDELEYLQRRHPNLHVTLTLTRAAGDDWSGYRGRIALVLMQKVVPELAAQTVHIFGRDQMIEQTRSLLRGLGMPAERVKSESFTAAAGPDAAPAIALPAPTDDAAPGLERAGTVSHPAGGGPSITFARSGKFKGISAYQTVLEASEELGVNIEYDCRSGICGTCKIKLVSGRVTMDVEDAIADDDRANNVILSCQARCHDHVVVEA